MTDIEQIAANADNLIEILQSIKQAKNSLSNKKSEIQTPGFPSKQQSAMPPTQAAAKAPNDFCVNPSQSPMHKIDDRLQKSDDLWDDNGVVREALEESAVSVPDQTSAQEESKTRKAENDFWDSPKKSDYVQSKKEPAVVKGADKRINPTKGRNNSKTTNNTKKKTSSVTSSIERANRLESKSRAGTNHDLEVDGVSVAAPSVNQKSREKASMRLNTNSSAAQMSAYEDNYAAATKKSKGRL